MEVTHDDSSASHSGKGKEEDTGKERDENNLEKKVSPGTRTTLNPNKTAKRRITPMAVD